MPQPQMEEGNQPTLPPTDSNQQPQPKSDTGPHPNEAPAASAASETDQAAAPVANEKEDKDPKEAADEASAPKTETFSSPCLDLGDLRGVPGPAATTSASDQPPTAKENGEVGGEKSEVKKVEKNNPLLKVLSNTKVIRSFRGQLRRLQLEGGAASSSVPVPSSSSVNVSEVDGKDPTLAKNEDHDSTLEVKDDSGNPLFVAPGFGTRADIEQLQKDLGETLPVEAVLAVMQSRGRGVSLRSKRGNDDGAESKPKESSSGIWANFMQDEGVMSALGANNSAVASTTTTTNITTAEGTTSKTVASTVASSQTQGGVVTSTVVTTTESSMSLKDDDGDVEYEYNLKSLQVPKKALANHRGRKRRH